MGINLHKMLEGVVKIGASDLHLKVGQKPMLRLHGQLRAIDHPELTQEDIEEANVAMMPDRLASDLTEKGAVDYSYGMSQFHRFRVNAFHQRGQLSLAIRKISTQVPTLADHNLPPSLETLVNYRRGLILVTGITGSGKSSTLAALINMVNQRRSEHIITIEDPIEFLFRDEKSLVQQIEVGSDVPDFKSAMRNALRQDPDIILMGELRDRDTVETAVHLVETGHLVLTTLHTTDAKQTVLRLLQFFPKVEHDLISEQLALSLQGVCCQRLIKTSDGKGRIPVCEILFNTPIIQKLIREQRYEDMQSVLNNGEDGMQSFDNHLVQLVKSEMITIDEALTVVHNEAAFRRALKGRSAGGDRRGLI